MKKRTTFVLLAVVAVAAIIVSMSPASGQTGGQAAPVYVTKMPAGFRNWK